MEFYAQEILRILMQAPDGLSATKISRHVYNSQNSIFVPIDRDEVHRDVLAMLQKWSKDPASYVERSDRRGYYRLRKDRANDCQLMFDFVDEQPEEEIPKDEQQELSLW